MSEEINPQPLDFLTLVDSILDRTPKPKKIEVFELDESIDEPPPEMNVSTVIEVPTHESSKDRPPPQQGDGEKRRRRRRKRGRGDGPKEGGQQRTDRSASPPGNKDRTRTTQGDGAKTSGPEGGGRRRRRRRGGRGRSGGGEGGKPPTPNDK